MASIEALRTDVKVDRIEVEIAGVEQDENGAPVVEIQGHLIGGENGESVVTLERARIPLGNVVRWRIDALRIPLRVGGGGDGGHADAD